MEKRVSCFYFICYKPGSGRDQGTQQISLNKKLFFLWRRGLFFQMRTSPPDGTLLNRNLGNNSETRFKPKPDPRGQAPAERSVDNRRSTDFKLLADLFESFIYDLFPGDQISYTSFFVLNGPCLSWICFSRSSLLLKAQTVFIIW